jgi:hypothetical protein
MSLFFQKKRLSVGDSINREEMLRLLTSCFLFSTDMFNRIKSNCSFCIVKEAKCRLRFVSISRVSFRKKIVRFWLSCDNKEG